MAQLHQRGARGKLLPDPPFVPPPSRTAGLLLFLSMLSTRAKDELLSGSMYLSTRISDLGEEQRKNAQMAVCAQSEDVESARETLSMLGLL